MENYRFKITKAIVDSFIENDLAFHVKKRRDNEVIYIDTPIDNGPSFTIHYLINDRNKSILTRSLLLHNVDHRIKNRIYSACNIIHRFINGFTCYIDEDNDLMLKYDLEYTEPYDDIGGKALNMFCSIRLVLNCIWPLIVKAAYTHYELSYEDLINDSNLDTYEDETSKDGTEEASEGSYPTNIGNSQATSLAELLLYYNSLDDDDDEST